MSSRSYEVNSAPSSEASEPVAETSNANPDKESLIASKKSVSKKTSVPNGTSSNGTAMNGTTNGSAIPNGKSHINGATKASSNSYKHEDSRLPYMTENEQRAISNESIANQVTKIFNEALREPRTNWGLQVEFIASCLGLSIGFSNYWKLPYLIHTHGGVAFLFCYVLLSCLVGLPLYYLESAIGQFAQLGCLHVWRCAPLMQGLGIAMLVLSLLTSIYNSQVTAYAVHYFFSSFINMEDSPLWSQCRSSWQGCYDMSSSDLCSFQNYSFPDPYQCLIRLKSSSRFYFEQRVLRIDDLGEIGKTGDIHWDVTLSLLFVWIIVFFFLLRGTKSFGKGALFTGVIPVCLSICFLVASVRKPGSDMGLKHFYDPNWEKLSDINLWQDAAQQVIFSLGVSYGSIYMLGSYNRFRNKVNFNVFAVWFVQLCTAVMAATMIFAFYGTLAHNLGITNFEALVNIKVSPLEILFTIIPDAIMRALPHPHIWCIFFYLMLMCIGIHSQFLLVETCLTTTYDALPRTRTKKFAVTLGLIIPLFLLGLPLCANTGFHILHLLESTVIGPHVLLITILELITLSLIYGVRNVSSDIKLMLGYPPSIFWKTIWVFVAPVTLIVIFVFVCINWEILLYKGRDVDQDWALYLTWILTLLPISMIPLTFIYTFIYKLCVKEPLFQPSPNWGAGVTEDEYYVIKKSSSPASAVDPSNITTIVPSE